MPFTGYIVEKLTDLGCSEIKMNPGRDYVSCNCPGGHDFYTPSFSVRKRDMVYNCLGCGISGSSYNFIVDLCGGTRTEWRKVAWEKIQYEYIHDFNRTNRKKSTISETEKYVNPELVAEWLTIDHPYMLENRRFDSVFLRRHGVGFSYKEDAVMFVVYDEKQKLRGVVKRGMSTNTYYFYGFDTTEFLYLCNFPYNIKKPIILVEGCIDALRLRSFRFENVFACWRSSGFKKDHISFVRKFPEAILMLDLDKAGVYGTQNIIKLLITNMRVSVAMKYPLAMDKPDPGNLIIGEAKRMLREREDAFFWKAPIFEIDIDCTA